MIKVIHKKDSHLYSNVIYIGRGSILGNPYTSIQGRETLAEFVVESRKESINCFKEYILKCIENKEKSICDILNKIYKQSKEGEVYLTCYCRPKKTCHGDVIKEIIDSKFIKKETPTNQIKLF